MKQQQLRYFLPRIVGNKCHVDCRYYKHLDKKLYECLIYDVYITNGLRCNPCLNEEIIMLKPMPIEIGGK
ncbi:hypothetical protein [Caudoviricetes sp.]|nr:hypothetical protein [Caudoviricetes sp.]